MNRTLISSAKWSEVSSLSGLSAQPIIDFSGVASRSAGISAPTLNCHVWTDSVAVVQRARPEGAISIDELIDDLSEEDHQLVRDARKRLATHLDNVPSLRTFRLEAGLSQQELADKTNGMSQPQIARLEQGIGNPTAATFASLGEALGCDPRAIFDSWLRRTEW